MPTTRELIVAGLGYALSAAVSTMPPKGTQWNREAIYDWFFDWAHMMVNSRRPTNAG